MEQSHSKPDDSRLQASETILLPITLPSLRIAWLEIPMRLTVPEYDALFNALRSFKDALTHPGGTHDQQ